MTALVSWPVVRTVLATIGLASIVGSIAIVALGCANAATKPSARRRPGDRHPDSCRHRRLR